MSLSLKSVGKKISKAWRSKSFSKFKRGYRHYATFKSLRKKWGLTGDQIKKRLNRATSTQPTSATDISYYPQYQPRRISEMM